VAAALWRPVSWSKNTISRGTLQNSKALESEYLTTAKFRKSGTKILGLRRIHRFLYENAGMDASRNVTLKAREVAFRNWMSSVVDGDELEDWTLWRYLWTCWNTGKEEAVRSGGAATAVATQFYMYVSIQ